MRQMLRDQHMTQPAGSTVRLRCRADAVPPASVVWIKDERLLVTPARRTAADGDEGDEEDGEGDEAGFVLRLWSVTSDDSGRYTCQVFNDVGHINFTYTLRVTGPCPLHYAVLAVCHTCDDR